MAYQGPYPYSYLSHSYSNSTFTGVWPAYSLPAEAESGERVTDSGHQVSQRVSEDKGKNLK